MPSVSLRGELMAWLDGLLADASEECLASQRGCTSPPRCSGTSAIGDAHGSRQRMPKRAAESSRMAWFRSMQGARCRHPKGSI